jgi:predicted ArsR family transcriptional regulator
MAITPAQQRLLDLCEDGEMETLQLAEQHEMSNRSVIALVHELAHRGLVEVLRREKRTDFHHLPRRRRTIYIFRLTAEGLTQHAPPPGWVEPSSEGGNA